MNMVIASNHLEAFLALGRELHFSRAADKLGVTQSALSQRIKKLEEDLEVTLVIRGKGGLRLTAVGQKLLRHCQIQEGLEEEFVADLRSHGAKELAGVLRVGAFSSVMRSVIIPALAPLVRLNPKVVCEFTVADMNDLPRHLAQTEMDFIVTDGKLDFPGVESCSLGHERYVMIEPRELDCPDNVYLDHDVDDTATYRFFRHQGKKVPSFKRAFMGDVYGILDGVAHGYGRAVMSRHIVDDGRAFRVLKQYKPMDVEVQLYYFSQPYYTRLHQAVVKELTARCPALLRGASRD